MDEKTVARFWGKVQKTDDCWLWTGGKNELGYGQFFLPEKPKAKAHRVAWLVAHGEWPSLCVLHRCDNPSCVRPDHLFLGTMSDNSADMARKLRAGGTILTGTLAKCALERVLAGETCAAVARDLGVSRSTVSLVANRKAWKWIHDTSATPSRRTK